MNDKQQELEVLVQARKLIEAGWCKWFHAVDGAGREVAFDSPGAKAWSIKGALSKAILDLGVVSPFDIGPFHNAIDALLSLLLEEWQSLMAWNDAPTTTHADVLALLDRAIERKRAEVGAE